MMRRLREEQDSADPGVARLVEMTKAARPLERSSTMEARVHAAVLERREPRRRPAMVWRPAMIVVLCIGSMAIASAMIGGAWIARRSSSRPVLPAPSAPEHSASRPAISATPTEPPVEPLPVGARVQPASASVRARPVHATQIVPSQNTETQDPPPNSAPQKLDVPGVAVNVPVSTSHEAALVATAVKALRGDHDPKRAQILFAEYRQLYPNGELAEEALALAVEAAAAQDDPEAGRLASQYLRQFPRGRFRPLAEQARKRFRH